MPLMPSTWKLDRERGVHVDPDTRREFITVTTALREAGCSNEFKSSSRGFKAAWKGTTVHDTLERLIKTPSPQLDIDRELKALDQVDGRGNLAAFLKFRREVPFEVIIENGILLSEVKICHLLYGFAGKFDVAAYIAGQRAMVDFKTGVPERSHALQTAGYALGLWGSLEGIKRYGLYLKSDGTYKLKPHENDEEDEIVFLSAVAVAKWKRKVA
jgi:hypothetical protein